MKIALHNFLTTLRRYKASSLLNIVGLTLAFTAFYVILVQVRWELTFNRAIPEAERIYLVAPRSPFDETGYSICSTRPDGEQLIAGSPEIEAGGCIRPWRWDQPVWVKRHGEFLRFRMSLNTVSKGFLETVGLRHRRGESAQRSVSPTASPSRARRPRGSACMQATSSGSATKRRNVSIRSTRWWPSTRISPRTAPSRTSSP